MSFIATLRQRFFRRRLAAELAGRRPDSPRPEHPLRSKRLAIVFPADFADDRTAVENLTDRRRAEGLKTELLGFFQQPPPANNAFDYPTYSKKDLNWYGWPDGPAVRQFLQNQSDLLYVLGPPDWAHFHYLGRVKPTGLRVGPYTFEGDQENFYNVQYRGDATTEVAGKLRQIDELFKIINVQEVTPV